MTFTRRFPVHMPTDVLEALALYTTWPSWKRWLWRRGWIG